MDSQLLRELLYANVNTDPLRLEQLPEIDLYMDQVLILLNDALEAGSRHAQEKLLTKTMVQNYTKAKLLQKPKGKKYSRSHVLMLVLIHQLKQTLSMEEIAALFALGATELQDAQGYAPQGVQQLFEGFSRLKLEQEGLADAIADNYAKLPKSESEPMDLLLTVLYLCNLSHTAALTAQRLLDHALQGEEGIKHLPKA